MIGLFISYARNDDEAFARQLYTDLTGRGFSVWWDREAMESRGRTFLQEIRDAIASVERLILVIGPAAVRSDYVEAEWKFALESCKPVIPVLRLGDRSLVPEELSKREYLLVPGELSKYHCPDFRAARPYLASLDELTRILRTPVPPLGTLFGVDPLPPHFQPRHDCIERIKDSVLADVLQPTVITSAKQTTALQGMGGIGKSVIAAGFARSCETRRSFGDGVLWLRFGQQASVTRNLALVGQAFNDDPQKYADIDQGKSHLAGLLASRNCLLILDDVWDVLHAEPFVGAAGARCRVLVTTRDGALVKALGAREQKLDVLSPEQALSLLSEWADEPAHFLPAEAHAVCDECGCLPLALAMVGAMVRNNPGRWNTILARLRNADLEKIRQQFPAYPYPDLLKAIQVSVDALEPFQRDRYCEFAVFPDDTPIPGATLKTYWGSAGLDEYDTEDFLIHLVDRSLVRRLGPDCFTLHDLQFDYVRKQAGSVQALHKKLVDAYGRQCSCDWPSGSDEGYFFEHLSHHMAEAGLTTDLYALIGKQWMDAQFMRTLSHRAFAADVEIAQRQARSEDPPNLVQEIRSCLIHSTLRSISSTIPLGAIGTMALLGHVVKARGIASMLPKDGQRRRAFRLIALALIRRGEDEEAKRLLISALADGGVRDIFLMAGIGPHLVRLGEWDRVAAELNGHGDQQDRANILCRVVAGLAEIDASHLIPAVLPRAAHEAAAMPEGVYKSQAFSRLAKALAISGDNAAAVEYVRRAQQIAAGVEDPQGRVRALGELACAFAFLGQTDEIRAVTEEILSSPFSYEGSALAIISLILSGDDERAFEECRQDYEKAAAATKALALKRDREGLDRLAIICRDPGPGLHRVGILSRIAQALARVGEVGRSVELANEAWAEARQGGDTSWAEETLNELAYAFALAGESSKAEEVLEVALKVAHSSEAVDLYVGFEVFGDLAERLVRSGFTPRAIAFANQAPRLESDRLQVLARVARVLANEGNGGTATDLILQTLGRAESMEDTFRRDSVLRHCLPALVELKLVEAIRHIPLRIEDVQLKVDALIDAGRFLAEHGMSEDSAESLVHAFHITIGINGAPGWKIEVVRKGLEILRRLDSLDEQLAFLLKTAGSIDDWSSKAETLGLVAEGLAKEGRFVEALEVAATIDDREDAMHDDPYRNENYRADAFSLVAKAMARSGSIDEAAALADEAAAPYGKAVIMIEVAAEAAGKGDTGRARELIGAALSHIEQIRNECRRGNALGKAIPALALAGEIQGLDHAMRLAECIANTHWKSGYLLPAVQYLAEGGEIDRAQLLADSTGRWAGSLAQSQKVATALIRHGRVSRALQLAEGIEYLPWRVDILASIHQALSSTGRTQESVDVDRRIRKIAEDSGDFRVVCAVAHFLLSIGCTDDGLAVWRRLLSGSQLDRKDLFEIIRLGGPLLSATDGGRTLERICEAVAEVEGWWGRITPGFS